MQYDRSIDCIVVYVMIYIRSFVRFQWESYDEYILNILSHYPLALN
jgi:hypothetical protein